MAASSSSPHLSPAHSSCQITGRPISAPRHVPAVRILSWRRFAASSSEVSLVPARLLRPPPRRRNALREKAAQPPPPLVVRHLVRPPCQESPDFGSLDSQEQKSGSFDAEPSSDLKHESVISGGQGAGASWSGDVASDSKLYELDVIEDAGEVEVPDPKGSVMQFEVHEGEIINRSEASNNDGRGGLESMSFRARATAMELESSQRVSPNNSDNSSRFHFTAPQRMGSTVLNGEVSDVRRSVPPSRSVAWSGFAVLCGFCIVFVTYKLTGSSSLTRLPRKLIDMLSPKMKEDEFDKCNQKVFRDGQESPDGLLRRPLLNRKELMSNIKKAQDSRNWSVLSNSFRCKDVSVYDDTNIPDIRRNVAWVPTSEGGILEKYGTKEKHGLVIPRPIDSTEEEISASYSSQYYLDKVSDSNETNGISLSQDKIEENMKQTVDLKNGPQVMNMSEKDQGNIGEIEVSEPSYSNNRATSTNDRNLMIYPLEKEAEIGSANVHKSDPNKASTPASEFESKEQTEEKCEKNLDCTQDIELSMVFISEEPMIYAKDTAHEFSTNLVSAPSDGFSILSSELTKNETHLYNNVSDLNDVQDVKATRASAGNAGIVGTKACETPVMTKTMTAISPQRNIEDLEDLRTANVQSTQGHGPSISSENGKQVSLGTENEHKERIVHNKTQTRMEIGHTRILNNASTPSFSMSPEETGQHIFAEVSTSEKKQERKKPRAHLPKKKGKLQKEVHSDKEAETEQSEQGKPGIETVADSTNHEQKTKRVPKKRQKKVQNEMQIAPALNDVQYSPMLDQKNNIQRVKKARRKNPKNTFHNQGAQAREENPETTYVISTPDNATTDNMKPLGVANSSVATQLSKDDFSEDQLIGSSPSTLRKEEKKLNFRTLERMKTVEVENENNMNVDLNETNVDAATPRR